MICGIDTLAVTSDWHFMAWKETQAPVEWVPSLCTALDDLASLRPNLLVVNGDLTNGKERDYRLAASSLTDHFTARALDCPVYYTMGNHEYYGYYEDSPFSSALAQERFLRHTGQQQIYQRVDRRGYTCLFLSTERYAPDMSDAGWLSDEQLTWCERQLSAAPAGPLLIFVHQPVNDTVADSNETLLQSDRLRAILSRRSGVFVFSGHTHCRMDRPDQLVAADGVFYVGGGCLCADAPQSRFVTMRPDSIQLRVRDHAQRRWLDDWERTVQLKDI